MKSVYELHNSNTWQLSRRREDARLGDPLLSVSFLTTAAAKLPAHQSTLFCYFWTTGSIYDVQGGLCAADRLLSSLVRYSGFNAETC